PGELLATADRELFADRQLGRQVSVELTPRWTPNGSFAVAAHYAYRSKSADRYVGSLAATDATGAPVTVDASLLGSGTAGHAQLAGFGITYSTLATYARGLTWLPAEVSYLHTSTITGSGGVVPGTHYDELAL